MIRRIISGDDMNCPSCKEKLGVVVEVEPVTDVMEKVDEERVLEHIWWKGVKIIK